MAPLVRGRRARRGGGARPLRPRRDDRDAERQAVRRGPPMTSLESLLGIDVPIIQAPMAGVQGAALAVAVSNAGGLGSLPAAMLSLGGLEAEWAAVHEGTTRAVN